MRTQRVGMLHIALSHIYRLQRLERLHNDPFDRMIIAQALEEQLPVVTADKILLNTMSISYGSHHKASATWILFNHTY